MSHFSEITQQIVERTSLREIDSTHYAGRHNDFFISIDIQGRLSRIASSISVYNLSENDFRTMEKQLFGKYGVDFSKFIFESNEILIFTPMKKKWLSAYVDIINDITSYLVAHGAQADPNVLHSSLLVEDMKTHSDIELEKRNYTAWGFLGSFLGSIPGVMGWFIITILQYNARIIQSPDLTHIISIGFLMAVIITCGSYWGYLLLSEGIRTRSFFLSLPVTIFMILFINCVSQAFLFYSTIPGISFIDAFVQTPSMVFRYDLAIYYFGSLAIAYLLSAITYFFIFRFREKGWQRGD